MTSLYKAITAKHALVGYGVNFLILVIYLMRFILMRFIKNTKKKLAGTKCSNISCMIYSCKSNHVNLAKFFDTKILLSHKIFFVQVFINLLQKNCVTP